MLVTLLKRQACKSRQQTNVLLLTPNSPLKISNKFNSLSEPRKFETKQASEAVKQLPTIVETSEAQNVGREEQHLNRPRRTEHSQ